MSIEVGIVNYGMGNIHSVYKQLRACHASVRIIENPEDFDLVDKIVLPGVGHFGKAMDNLRALSLLDPLNEAVLSNHKPILGICLGMQLMCRHSEEGDSDGLGWFDANIFRLKVDDDTLNYKVPHIGWNSVSFDPAHPLMKNIAPEGLFYFVHSFCAAANTPDTLNTTIYKHPFSSALGRDHIFGVQYHPEKSHQNGIHLLQNFLNI